MGVADDGGYEAIFEGYAEGQVDCGMLADARAGPRSVHGGHAAERFGGSLQDEVIDRKLKGGFAALFREALVQRFA